MTRQWNVDEHERDERKERRVPERMDKARVVQRLDVVAEADELRVRGRLEFAEREVHALAERIDKSDAK